MISPVTFLTRILATDVIVRHAQSADLYSVLMSLLLKEYDSSLTLFFVLNPCCHV